MQTRQFIEQDLELLRAREHIAFPTVEEDDEDAKEKAYHQWTLSPHNISLVFTDEAGNPVGLVAAIALNKAGWDYMYDPNDDDINEYMFVDEMLFDPSRDRQLGIYIYMIEKLDRSISGFTEIAYREVFNRAREIFPDLSLENMLGVAGYSVSLEAIHVALDIQGRVEVKPVISYVLYDPEGNLIAKQIRTEQEMQELIDKGYKVRNRARLSAVTPDMPSPVWEWFES